MKQYMKPRRGNGLLTYPERRRITANHTDRRELEKALLDIENGEAQLLEYAEEVTVFSFERSYNIKFQAMAKIARTKHNQFLNEYPDFERETFYIKLQEATMYQDDPEGCEQDPQSKVPLLHGISKKKNEPISSLAQTILAKSIYMRTQISKDYLGEWETVREKLRDILQDYESGDITEDEGKNRLELVQWTTS